LHSLQLQLAVEGQVWKITPTLKSLLQGQADAMPKFANPVPTFARFFYIFFCKSKQFLVNWAGTFQGVAN